MILWWMLSSSIHLPERPSSPFSLPSGLVSSLVSYGLLNGFLNWRLSGILWHFQRVSKLAPSLSWAKLISGSSGCFVLWAIGSSWIYHLMDLGSFIL